jgi:CheY-like chemotaxis protein
MGSVAGLAIAVAAVAAALALAVVLASRVHGAAEPLFLLAIAVSAIQAGLWPGLMAFALSAAALNWVAFPPERAFGFETRADLLSQLIFAVCGLLIAVIGGRARAIHRWAEARAAEAEFRVESAEGRLAARRRRSGGRRSLTETVLIVDPDADTRQTASRAVEAAGYRWVSACDGVEALELLDRYDVPFALVVTDVGLPDISGPELMRRIEKRRPGLPVLYTSALPGAGERGAPPPAEPLIEKPFTADELAQRTRDLLARRPAPMA